MRGRALAVLMSIYYGVLGLAMAGAGIVTDVAGPRATWALAGCVYLGASLTAFVMTRHTRAALEALDAPPPSGLERLESLLTEIDTARAVERAPAAAQAALHPAATRRVGVAGSVGAAGLSGPRTGATRADRRQRQ